LNTLAADVISAEIVGSRNILMTYAGVPRSQLSGFRHPFLAYNKATFDAVFAAGSIYDSSVTVDPVLQPFWYA